MQAAYYEEYGPASVLKFGPQPTPVPKARQLLVRVHASSVNPVDWKIRRGDLKLITGFDFPKIPGRDVAGTVAAVGEEVTRFGVGAAVYGMASGIGGANAEFALMDEDTVAFKPENLDFAQAAAVPLVALTALQGLRDHAGLLSGDRVLINGASGGVGLMAVQLARALGAGEITGTCGPGHLEAVRAIGADRVLNYQEHDFTQDASRYDIVFDAAGKSSFRASQSCLRNHGRYVTTTPAPGTVLDAFSAAFSTKKQAAFMARNSGSDLALITAWLKAGTLRPSVDKTFALSDIAAAQDYSEQGESSGKVLLTVG